MITFTFNKVEQVGRAECFAQRHLLFYEMSSFAKDRYLMEIGAKASHSKCTISSRREA
jgi:hypothetical protein